MSSIIGSSPTAIAAQAVSLGAIAYGQLVLVAKRGKIGAVELDATIQENHATRNKITDHEVEEGSNISDHVRPQPDQVTMVGRVSNHPLERSVDVSDTAVGGGTRLVSPDAERAETAYGDLLFLSANAIPVTVVTSLNVYEDMVIEDLQVPRDSKLSNVLHFTCQLRAIRKVTSETVAAPNTDVTTAKPQVSKGKKPATPAPAQDSSFGFNAIFGG